MTSNIGDVLMTTSSTETSVTSPNTPAMPPDIASSPSVSASPLVDDTSTVAASSIGLLQHRMFFAITYNVLSGCEFD